MDTKLIDRNIILYNLPGILYLSSNINKVNSRNGKNILPSYMKIAKNAIAHKIYGLFLEYKEYKNTKKIN